MSFLRAASFRARALWLRPPVAAPMTVPRTAVPAPAAMRPLSAAAVLRHGESQSNDPDFKVDKLKEASLQQQKKGQGEWMAALASDSEEDVKADKSTFDLKNAVAQAKAVHKKAAAKGAAKKKG